MYTLYYLPDACSLATQVVLNELNQDVEIINKQQVANFAELNPVNTVPLLVDGDKQIREGAAVMLHLLTKHPNQMLPLDNADKYSQAIQNILFANATMHPAYGRLFFIAGTISDTEAKQQAFDTAAQAINNLWSVVEGQLENQPFLGGETISAADIMLTVYSRWGAHFPVAIEIGDKTQQMLDKVLAMPSFVKALAAEAQQAAA